MAIAGELDEWLSRARLRPEILNDGNGKFSDANGNFGDGNGKREPDGEDDRLFFLFLGGGQIKTPQVHGCRTLAHMSG
jgi:hypothetical protein